MSHRLDMLWLLIGVLSIGCKERPTVSPAAHPSPSTHPVLIVPKTKPSVETDKKQPAKPPVANDASTSIDASMASPPHYKTLLGTLPKVHISEGSAALDGLPAVSGDGNVVAVEQYFETVANDQLIAVHFMDINPGKQIEKVVIFESTTDGKPLPFPNDEYGNTLWRRAKNVNVRFVNEGFRSLTPLTSITPDNPKVRREFSGEGIRVFMTNQDRLVVRSSHTGKRLFVGQVPFGNVTAVWFNPKKRVVVIQHGIEYASCMQPNVMDYFAFALPK